MDKKEISDIVRDEIYDSVLKTKKFIIAANWKMNKTSGEVEQYLKTLKGYCFSGRNQVIIFPPSPYLYLFRKNADGYIEYGVENLYYREKGAFTGEISTAMAKDFGCKYAIVGHSERRNLFGETDELIGKKTAACIHSGIRPILCVGEHLDERKSGI